MKQSQLLLLLLGFSSLYTCLGKVLNIYQYSARVILGIDGQYRPLTKEMCKDFRFKYLKSCLLLDYDKQKLDDYSDTYMTYPLNYWKNVDSTDSVGSLSTSIKSIISRSYFTSRRRRSLHDRLTAHRPSGDEDVDARETLHRSKRDIPGNPCTNGKAKRTTVFYGVDAETGKVLELLQNPDKNLFQTFYTRRCYLPSFFSLNCEIVYTEYLSAVYKDDTYQVITRPVKIPTGCALAVS